MKLSRISAIKLVKHQKESASAFPTKETRRALEGGMAQPESREDLTLSVFIRIGGHCVVDGANDLIHALEIRRNMTTMCQTKGIMKRQRPTWT